jgi:hypothetical protein
MTALEHRPPNPLTTAHPRKREQIRAVAVVIPAHDEQELLDACLDVLEAAAWRVRDRGIPVLPFVVADACTDATRAMARRRDLTVCTSARVSKRLRGGFSDYLSSLEEPDNAHTRHARDEQQPAGEAA